MAELLHFNDFAYVARCPAHPYLSLCFGTLAVALTAPELRELRQQVAALPFPAANPADRLLLATPAHRWAAALTESEADQLLEVLNVTALLLEAEQLLKTDGGGSTGCASCPYAG